MRKTPLITIALLFALILAGGTQAWAASSSGAGDNRTIRVEGQAVLKLAPDQVEFNFGVNTTSAKAQEAAQKNAQAMKRLLEALKAITGPGESLRSQGYSLGPAYKYDPATRKNKQVGFKASNQVVLTSPRTNMAGKFLDAAVSAGANRINGPYWSLAHGSKARIKAQAAAYADALRQAKALAKAAGASLGPVASIDTAGGGRPEIMPRMALAKAAPQTPMEPGLITVQASVICLFKLGEAE